LEHLGGSNEVNFQGRFSVYNFRRFGVGARTDGERSEGIEVIEGKCQS
jgi:hypothetical protein